MIELVGFSCVCCDGGWYKCVYVCSLVHVSVKARGRFRSLPLALTLSFETKSLTEPRPSSSALTLPSSKVTSSKVTISSFPKGAMIQTQGFTNVPQGFSVTLNHLPVFINYFLWLAELHSTWSPREFRICPFTRALWIHQRLPIGRACEQFWGAWSSQSRQSKKKKIPPSKTSTDLQRR